MPPPGWPMAVVDTVRFSDCDMLGHVNNARYLSFFEEARIQYIKDAAAAASDATLGGNYILLSASVRFHVPAHFGDTLECCARVLKIGNTSLEFEQAVFRGGVLIAEGTAVIVAMNYADGSKERVGDNTRAAVKKLEAGREVPGT